MRPGLPLSAVTAIVLLLSACGDDEPGVAGTTTGTGGAGGEISNGGGGQGDGGEGGDGDGGNGGQVGDGGNGGQVGSGGNGGQVGDGGNGGQVGSGGNGGQVGGGGNGGQVGDGGNGGQVGDGGNGGQVGGGGNGGQVGGGGAGNQGGDGDPSGAGGDGAPAASTGQGGAGNDGGAGNQGGEGGNVAEAKADGEPCTTDDECSNGLCLTEEDSGWAGGYCTSLCAEGLRECDPGSACVKFNDQSALCIRTCTTDADCPGAARYCAPLAGSVGGCVGGCETDAQCTTACDNDVGSCSEVAEICDNGLDDDQDWLQDCEEIDCATQAACTDGIAAACRAAIDVSGDGTFTGTTDGGTNLFSSLCLDLSGNWFPVGSGGDEKVFRFVAPASGVLRFLPAAISGTFDVYLRTSCDDAESVFGCLPPLDADGRPVEIDVSEGETFYLFIDSEAGSEYALEVDFLAPICGDGEVLSPEACDDANDDDDDLCNNECVINTEVECASVTPVTREAAGDTREGVRGLAGSCGGVGPELIYQYSPTATGRVTITARPTNGAADLVLYAQSTCGDDATELGCRDAGYDGDLETLTINVTEAEPITIVVDSYRDSVSGPFTLTITQE